MKIGELILREEYIFSEADESLCIDKIATRLEDLSENTLLIIPNSKKVTKISNLQTPPKAVICDSEVETDENIPKILVSNARLALARACFRLAKLDTSTMKLIGVTGTNGKTTTASLIFEGLLACGFKPGFIGTGKIAIGRADITSEYYSMTTPDPPLLYPVLKRMQLQGCDTVVMEVSSHALALDKVEPLIFDFAVFTNLSDEHLDFHKTTEEYFAAKKKLLKNASTAVFNIDDEYARRAYGEFSGKKISIGAIHDADVRCTNIENHGLDGIRYLYRWQGHTMRMELKLAGIYNAYNSMLAAAVCIELGCKACRVKEIFGEIVSIPGRFEIINGEITVIIDYAHTDFAYYNIMKELYNLKRGNSLTVVFGCGGERDKQKRPRMAKIAEQFADRIIVTTDNSRSESPKEIIMDIIRGFESDCYEIIEDRETAIKSAILAANDGDIVAVIGKGAEKYNIDSLGYHPFDEKKIISAALSERRRIGE